MGKKSDPKMVDDSSAKVADEKAKAKAAKATKPSAQEMSGGAVKPTPKPNAAAKGAAAMDDFVSGTKADGSYMSGAERKAAFNAARDSRFTMPNEPVVERSIVPVQQTESALVKVAQPTAAAETGVAKMAATAESAASKGSMLRGLTSPAFVVPALTAAADAVVPRADDTTSLGYDVNTARDTATSAINAGALTAGAMQLLRLKNPYLIGGAAALAGGKALYDRLSDYNSANPEAEQQPYALPNARANFWEQAPAAISDAGRIASQVLRYGGDQIGGFINNYTLWPYTKKAAQAVGDYFTPPASAEAPASQIQVDEPAASAQPEPTPQLTEGPLPPNTERLPDGRLRRELFGADGQRQGSATGTFQQVDRLSRPSEQELQDQARQKVADSVQQILFARRVAQDREWKERTSPQAAQQFFDRLNAEEALRDAMNRGTSNDPARNAMKVQGIMDAATRLSGLTGKSVDELLPADSDARNVRTARDLLRQGTSLSLNEIGIQAAGMSPSSATNYYGDDETYQQAVEKQSVSKQGAAIAAQNKAEQQASDSREAANKSAYAAERLALQQENADRANEASARADEALELRKKEAQITQQRDVLNQIARSQAQIANLTVKLAGTLMPDDKQRLEEQLRQQQRTLGANYARAAELGIDLGDVVAEEEAASPTPETNAPPTTKVVDGKTYIQQNGKWFGPI